MKFAKSLRIAALSALIFAGGFISTAQAHESITTKTTTKSVEKQDEKTVQTETTAEVKTTPKTPSEKTAKAEITTPQNVEPAAGVEAIAPDASIRANKYDYNAE